MKQINKHFIYITVIIVSFIIVFIFLNNMKSNKKTPLIKRGFLI